MRARSSADHGSAPNTPGAQRQSLTRAQPGLGQRLAQPDRVRRGAGQDVRAQVPDQRDLPRRHPAGHRDDRGAQRDRALVNAQPAGEQPVPVRVVDQAAARPRPPRPAPARTSAPTAPGRGGYTRPASAARRYRSNRGTRPLPSGPRPACRTDTRPTDPSSRPAAAGADHLDLYPFRGPRPPAGACRPARHPPPAAGPPGPAGGLPAAQRAAQRASTRPQARTSSFLPALFPAPSRDLTSFA